MKFEPTPLGKGAKPLVHAEEGGTWTPMFRHECSFGPDLFDDVLMNLIKNPNINSSWLYRADVLFDSDDAAEETRQFGTQPCLVDFLDFKRYRTLVTRLVPRNPDRDRPLEQTQTFSRSSLADETIQTLIVYVPHETSEADLPFYYPKVQGLAYLHEWDQSVGQGTISIHYRLFRETDAGNVKLTRTALNLLSILYKHGQGRSEGYTKRVFHDVLVPQARVQDRVTRLKQKYARGLIASWAEATDPSKHVFEDLGIAAFLIELWADMYRDRPFPGFVDIGCGNGLLVFLLAREGYSGFGFDARARRSWENYTAPEFLNNDTGTDSNKIELTVLERRVLLPSVIYRPAAVTKNAPIPEEDIHDGLFRSGTFIISNHADELTPWTPILAALSNCPFVMIPCCSHNLRGDKYRAPPPRDRSKPVSAYASLVDWVSCIAEDCGWVVETEMLRIPSTRNTALIGRTRTSNSAEIDAESILQKYGGAEGYFENVVKLLKAAPSKH